MFIEIVYRNNPVLILEHTVCTLCAIHLFKRNLKSRLLPRACTSWRACHRLYCGHLSVFGADLMTKLPKWCPLSFGLPPLSPFPLSSDANKSPERFWCYIENSIWPILWSVIAHPVQRLATGCAVRGSNPGGGQDFLHPSRPALGPIQPSVKRAQRLFRG